METGKIKWFNQEKGYGFIIPDDGSKDVFVHISEMQKGGIGEVEDGLAISFDLTESRGKTCACNVKVV